MLLLNESPVKYFKFPGGELQVQLAPITTKSVTLTWKPKNSDDILHLLLTINALRKECVSDINLECLYLPYARQDRVCARGESFSLEVIANILDNLDLSQIEFWDIHNSDVFFSLFSKTKFFHHESIDAFRFFNILEDLDSKKLILCAPDKGCVKKVEKISHEFNISTTIKFNKDRDQLTGVIKGISAHNDNPDNYEGSNILIIDDICDGGSTFIEVAKKIREHNTADLFLYVTHGIFSKGLEELYKYYDHIYCYHVLHDDKYWSNDKLTILREFIYET